MTQKVPLDPGVEARLRELGQVDLLVGIPSFNNARTIGHVVRAASAGLAKYFPGARAVIVNSDGGSTDGTWEAVAAAEAPNPATILVAHPVSPVQRIALTTASPARAAPSAPSSRSPSAWGPGPARCWTPTCAA